MWTLESFWREGMADSWLLDQYPGLTALDLEEARRFVKRHREEIESDLRAQEEPD